MKDAAANYADNFDNRCKQGVCRLCKSVGLLPVIDLGLMPCSDGLLREEQLRVDAQRYPLELAFCSSCSLVQIIETLPPDRLFGERYLYFSSYSEELLSYTRKHATELIEEFALDEQSLVVELASNDGYMLKNFAEHNIPVLGIEPAPKQVETAEKSGIETICGFFDQSMAKDLTADGRKVDLVIAKNVVAHVADTNGFVAGISRILKEEGRAVIEFPYVRDLIEGVQFDTIYHEHLCYFSVTSANELFRRNNMYINKVERVDIHGGSLRFYISLRNETDGSLGRVLREEQELGLTDIDYYRDFADVVNRLSGEIKAFIQQLKQENKRIVAYGAAAKGTILLNYLELDSSSLDYVVDRNTHKQGMYMPGANLKIHAPERIMEDRPDYVLILPWNFKDEIIQQQKAYSQAGGRFIVPVPELTII